MKKYASTLVALSLLLSTTGPALSAEGTSCHFHGNAPATQNVVTQCALQRKTSLITSGKLDKSWDAVKPEKSELVDGKKGKEWKVSFKNATAPDTAKNTLYVFMSLTGNYIAANFTGQ